jgi:hypothetical protein
VGEPLEQDLAGEVIERAGPAADHDPPAAQVDVIKADLADRLDASGVHRGEDQDQPGGGSGGRLCCLADLVLAQRLDDPPGALADRDALDRAAEDRLLPLAEREQRPQRHQDVGAAGSVKLPEDGEDVAAGDLAQVAVLR